MFTRRTGQHRAHSAASPRSWWRHSHRLTAQGRQEVLRWTDHHRDLTRWWAQQTTALFQQRLAPSIGSLSWRDRRAPVAAAGLLFLFGLAPTAAASGDSNPPDPTVHVAEAAARTLADREDAASTPSRSLPREAADLALTVPPPTEAAESPAASPEPVEEPEPKLPEPIAGLNERQMEHAATIIRVGQEMGLPEQAYVIALATAMQESTLRVLANPTYPESYDLPNDGEGWDHDSVGLFQQRPVSGWGTVEECMDPETSARSFYRALQRISNWENLPVTVAAQAVQVSAFPNHYAKHEALARKLVELLA